MLGGPARVDDQNTLGNGCPSVRSAVKKGICCSLPLLSSALPEKKGRPSLNGRLIRRGTSPQLAAYPWRDDPMDLAGIVAGDGLDSAVANVLVADAVEGTP